jgi:AtzE family amidohydrolase
VNGEVQPDSALEIARAVRSGGRSAASVLTETFIRIERANPCINAFTRLFRARAQAEAAEVDAKLARGEDPGLLAGVPYGVKDLFDVAGESTTAGSGARRQAPPAQADAEVVRRLAAAGAVLVGGLNMDEYAYGFVTVNAAFGTTRNPHDLERLAGGSSGGAAAAVAAGLVPFALGSDTNGSIRAPASLCGVYGLRATHGRVPVEGAFPFVHNLDVVGPFARTLADLEAVDAVLAGRQEGRGPEPQLRIGRLDGWFDQATEEVHEALRPVAETLDAHPIRLERAEAARSAAFVLTAMEGGALHFEALRRDPMAFDPAVRDRLIAGVLTPGVALSRVERVRRLFRLELERLFERADVLIAPATPCTAPRVAEPEFVVDGRMLPARAHLGMLAQPLSLAGIPVLTAPLRRSGGMPVGVQLAAPAGREDRLFAVAERLERSGHIAAASLPT